MKDYLKVGDWVQIQPNDPWTKIVESETLYQNARDNNRVQISIYSKPHKILRKGSVYIQKIGSDNYVVLFERVKGTLAHGTTIFPAWKGSQDLSLIHI